MELWAGSGTHFVLTQITLQECTHTRFAGLPLCSQYHSVARMTSPSLGARQGTGTGTWAPNPVVLSGEEVGIRRRPRGPLPPSPHILCFPPAAAQEALSASHREGAAREPGEAISVQSGQAAGAGGAWRWRQRRRPSVCFYFIQQKVLFVEANRRWGLELGGVRKRKKKPHPPPRTGLPRNCRVGVNDWFWNSSPFLSSLPLAVPGPRRRPRFQPLVLGSGRWWGSPGRKT